jgi:hypothetical protein
MFSQKLRTNGQTQLLPQLTESAEIIVFAGMEMPGSAGIITARAGIFILRALLDKQICEFIENENMNRAMTQLAGVDFAPRRLTDNPISFVHHVENLIGLLHGFMKTQLMEKESPPNPGGFLLFGSKQF